MPRSRNIKHGFFTNDDLAEVPPLGRLLFIGLWTLADFNGNLEWKPKRIKAQILPYDDCDIEKLGIYLDKSGFISIYSLNGNRYANITNFDKHQRPHINEKKKGTDIPEFDGARTQVIDSKGVGTNPDSIGSSSELIGTNTPDSCSLIPDSCSPNPDHLIPDSSDKPSSKQTPDKPDDIKKIPPKISDVRDYMAEREFADPGGESEKFCDFYESNGWKVGKNKMKSWQASVRNWQKNVSTRNGFNKEPETVDQFVSRATAAGERLQARLDQRDETGAAGNG